MSANGCSHIDQNLVKDSVPGNPGGNAYQAFVKKLPSLVGCARSRRWLRIKADETRD
jgi:hypothetical protein